MRELGDMLWIEMRKAIRSRVPLSTAVGSMFLPVGIGLLLFIAKNPAVSQKLGLISAKADLMAFTATNWQTYLNIYSQLIALGGFMLFVLIVSWVFGREFTNGTIKDLLAVPVRRSSILLAKFMVAGLWSAMMTIVIYLAGLGIGAALRLPEGSLPVLLHGSAALMAAAGLTILVALPFAFLASAGRGYLLPMGLGVLTLLATNLTIVLGWGDLFPWAIPGLFAQGQTALPPVSYVIVLVTGLAGMAITYGWWKTADQHR